MHGDSQEEVRPGLPAGRLLGGGPDEDGARAAGPAEAVDQRQLLRLREGQAGAVRPRAEGAQLRALAQRPDPLPHPHECPLLLRPRLLHLYRPHRHAGLPSRRIEWLYFGLSSIFRLLRIHNGHDSGSLNRNSNILRSSLQEQQ